MTAADPLTMRDRLLEATYTCIARFGLAKTTVEDVVKASGISRATIYRHFPGVRDELLRETVAWETPAAAATSCMVGPDDDRGFGTGTSLGLVIRI